MTKRAYETYYRDKFGELKVQLVDAETGELVTDSKGYTVVDSTDVQGQEVTGNPAVEDTSSATPSEAKTGPKPTIIKRFAEGGDRGKRGKGAKGNVSNNFGFVHKPSWSKYVSAAVGLVNPMAGMAAKAVDIGINANNVNAINQAREFLGLEKMSTKDVLKGSLAGVDETVGDVKIGNKTYGAAFGGAVIDGKTTMTPQEVRTRQDIKTMQDKVYEHLTKNGFAAKSKLHPELDPMTDVNDKKGVTKGKGLAAIGKAKGLPSGLSMVDGYRAKLDSVNFDDFDIDPVTREKAKEFQKEAKARNLDLAVDVKNMVRTPEDQAAEVASGHSKTLQSEHMSGVGLDISPVDDKDQAGWAAKRSLAEEQGWNQLDPSWDPAHMGVTQGLGISPARAIQDRNYFGNVPVTSAQREQLGLPGGVPTPTDRPTTAPAQAQGTVSSKESFYAEQYGYAKEAGLTGLAADIAVSQAAIESGYGTGQLASKSNNMHSMKAGKSWAGPTASYKDDEVGLSSFRSYANPVESYKDWAKVMETNFPDVLTAKDLAEATAGLQNGRLGAYATAPDYAEKLAQSYAEARSFAPIDIDPKASAFSKYSAGFYSAIQTQPDPQAQANKARQDAANRPQIAQMDSTTGLQTPAGLSAAPGMSSTANFGRIDSPSSGRPSSASFGSTTGTGSSNYGRSDSPSSGRSGFGSSAGGGSFGHGYGAGMSSVGKGSAGSSFSAGPSGFSSGSKSGSSTSFSSGNYASKSTSDKEKDRSVDGRAGAGGFGNYAGGGEKI